LPCHSLESRLGIVEPDPKGWKIGRELVREVHVTVLADADDQLVIHLREKPAQRADSNVTRWSEALAHSSTLLASKAVAGFSTTGTGFGTT
jgi:hypothetical protein